MHTEEITENIPQTAAAFKRNLELRSGNIETLVEKLRAQSLLKVDIIVPSNNIRMDATGNIIVNGRHDDDEDNGALSSVLAELEMTTKGELSLLPFNTAHGAIAEKLGINLPYYNKMIKHPLLLKENVNYWMRDVNKNYLLRIFEDQSSNTGYLRTVLSDRFFTLDNWDVLMATLDAVKQSGAELNIDACDISEQKMYIRFTSPNIEVDAPTILKNYRLPDGTIPNNPKICAGFIISNSEIGCGKFMVSPRIMVLACRNGMIRKEDGWGKTHLGAKLEENQVIKFSEETKNKNIELVISQIKDAIKTFCSQDYLNKVVAEYEEKGSQPLAHPIQAVENMSKFYGMTETRTQSILDYFIKSGDSSRFGAVQAMTFYAHKDADADGQYELECASTEALDKMPTFDKAAKAK